ncbi:MAG: DNA repair exonuclease, partial [Bilophila sp.]
LDALLRRGSTCAELVTRLRDAPPKEVPYLWVKDMDVCTRPRLDRAKLLEREDLLGETIRLAEAARETGLAALQDAALGTLFGNSRARKVLQPLTETEMARLLDDAESLCLDLLEND